MRGGCELVKSQWLLCAERAGRQGRKQGAAWIPEPSCPGDGRGGGEKRRQVQEQRQREDREASAWCFSHRKEQKS